MIKKDESTTTPNRYKPENQKWVWIDQKKNCKEKTVICPVCKSRLRQENRGHPKIYLNSSRQTDTKIGVDIVIAHAHFTSDIDRGRNCWCVVSHGMIDKDELVIKYALPSNNKLPRWIRDKLNSFDDVGF